MAAPATDDLRELARLLTVAAETDEPLSLNRVREEFDCGVDEALGMLGTLREHGQAVEVAPGEWQGPGLEELAGAPAPADGRVVVSVPDGLPDEPGDAGDAGAPPARGQVVYVGEPTVRLTMAIAETLDAQVIGSLVKAAIDGVGAGETFILEITP